jgi:enoyl-CoA hydratase/carnithine racemase
MSKGLIRLTMTRRGHVAAVTFGHGPYNHINLPLVRALGDALDGLDDDPDCRAIVLRAEGKVFCAGADLSVPNGLGDDDAEDFTASTLKFYEQAARLFAIRKPMVAAVQGAAVGAGLGLALAADFRVAAPEARFAANFVKLGFHPGFAITHTLPCVVGRQRAAAMLLTGRRIPGDVARAWGLADQLAPLDSLFDDAMAMAGEIAENGPLAVEATRATLRREFAEAARAAMAAEAAAQAKLSDTHDFAEGVRAVRERRPGQFRRR